MKKIYRYVDGEMKLKEEVAIANSVAATNSSELQNENDRLKTELSSKTAEFETKYAELQNENDRLLKQIEKLKARQA